MKKPKKPTAKIYQFPKNRIVRVPKTLTDKNIRSRKKAYMDYLLKKHMSMILNKLAIDGVDIQLEAGASEGPIADDFMFFGEALKSALYRVIGEPHDIQKFVDNNFKPDRNNTIELELDDPEEDPDPPLRVA